MLSGGRNAGQNFVRVERILISDYLSCTHEVLLCILFSAWHGTALLGWSPMAAFCNWAMSANRANIYLYLSHTHGLVTERNAKRCHGTPT